jgi:hypothetical protein
MPSNTETYDLGDMPRFSAAFAVAGVATDPGVVKFKWLIPDGTESEYVFGADAEVVRAGAGNYYVDLILNVAGTWTLRWVSAGTCTSAEEFRLRVEASAFEQPLAT